MAFDFGIGILFGLDARRGEAARHDGRGGAGVGRQRDVAGGDRRGALGAFPIVYATLFSAFYLALLLMLAGLILRGVAFEFRYKAERMRPVGTWALPAARWWPPLSRA